MKIKILWLFLICLFSFPCFASEQNEEDIIIAPKEVIEGDLRLVGKTVEVSGRIEGDLYVFASQVYIDGEVQGDVIACTGLLDISGHVHGNVRCLGGQVVLSGQIERNVSVCSASLEASTSSEIFGNIFALTGACDLLGHVYKNASLFASFVRLSGKIGGQLSAHVGSLRITSHAFVGKGVSYYSSEIARIDRGANLHGEIIHNPSLLYNMSQSEWLAKLKLGSKVAGLLMNFCFTALFGLILIHYFRPKLNRAVSIIHERFISTLLTGIVVVILLPILALIFLVSIVGAPFALGLIALNVFGFYSAKIVTLYYIASKAFKRRQFSKYFKRYFILITICYFIVNMIPYLGWIVSVLFMLLGFGAIISRNRFYTQGPLTT